MKPDLNNPSIFLNVLRHEQSRITTNRSQRPRDLSLCLNTALHVLLFDSGAAQSLTFNLQQWSHSSVGVRWTPVIMGLRFQISLPAGERTDWNVSWHFCWDSPGKCWHRTESSRRWAGCPSLCSQTISLHTSAAHVREYPRGVFIDTDT